MTMHSANDEAAAETSTLGDSAVTQTPQRQPPSAPSARRRPPPPSLLLLLSLFVSTLLALTVSPALAQPWTTCAGQNLTNHWINVTDESAAAAAGRSSLFASERWNVSLAIDESADCDFRAALLLLQANITCIPLYSAPAGAVAVQSGSCGQLVLLELDHVDRQSALMELQAPLALPTAQIVYITFEVSNENYTAPDPVEWRIEPQATFNVTGAPLHLTAGRSFSAMAFPTESPTADLSAWLFVEGRASLGHALNISALGGLELVFNGSAAAQPFTVVAPVSNVSYVLTLSFSVGGQDVAHYAVPAPIEILVQPAARIAVASTTPLPHVFSSQRWNLSFALSEAPLVDAPLHLTANVTCASAVQGGSCGQVFEFALTGAGPFATPLQLEAPAVLAAQMLSVTFALSGPGAVRFDPPAALHFSIMPQASITLTGLPSNLTAGRSRTGVATLAEAVSAGMAVSLLVEVHSSGGHAVQTIVLEFLGGGALSSLTVAAPLSDQSYELTLSFSVAGSDAPHYAASAPVLISVRPPALILAATPAPARALPGAAFTVGLALSAPPFAVAGAEPVLLLTALVDGGAQILGSAELKFNESNWAQVQLVTVLPPPFARFSLSSRQAPGREGVRAADTLAVAPVSPPDPSFTLSFGMSGDAQEQFLPFPSVSVSLLSAVGVSGFPAFAYLGSASTATVAWSGTSHAQVQLDVRAQVTSADGVVVADTGASVAPASMPFDGLLFPYSLVVRAPAAMPPGPSSVLVVSWALGGADVGRFGAAGAWNASIPLRAQAVLSVSGVPGQLFAGQSSLPMSIALSEPVSVGRRLIVRVTATSAQGSTAARDAGSVAPALSSGGGGVLIEGGSSGATFVFTAPMALGAVTLSFTLDGDDAPHFAVAPGAAALAPVLIQPSLPMTLLTPPPLSAPSGSSYTVRVSAPAAPAPGLTVVLLVSVEGGGSVQPAVAYFGASNFSTPVSLTVVAPTLASPHTSVGQQVVRFAVSGAPGFFAPEPASVFVTPIPSVDLSSTGAAVPSSSSSTGSNGTDGRLGASSSSGGVGGAHVSSSSDSLPTGLVVVIAVVSALVFLALLAFLVVFCRRSQAAKQLEQIKYQSVKQPIMATGGAAAGTGMAVVASDDVSDAHTAVAVADGGSGGSGGGATGGDENGTFDGVAPDASMRPQQQQQQPQGMGRPAPMMRAGSNFGPGPSVRQSPPQQQQQPGSRPYGQPPMQQQQPQQQQQWGRGPASPSYAPAAGQGQGGNNAAAYSPGGYSSPGPLSSPTGGYASYGDGAGETGGAFSPSGAANYGDASGAMAANAGYDYSDQAEAAWAPMGPPAPLAAAASVAPAAAAAGPPLMGAAASAEGMSDTQQLESFFASPFLNSVPHYLQPKPSPLSSPPAAATAAAPGFSLAAHRAPAPGFARPQAATGPAAPYAAPQYGAGSPSATRAPATRFSPSPPPLSGGGPRTAGMNMGSPLRRSTTGGPALSSPPFAGAGPAPAARAQPGPVTFHSAGRPSPMQRGGSVGQIRAASPQGRVPSAAGSAAGASVNRARSPLLASMLADVQRGEWTAAAAPAQANAPSFVRPPTR